nr:uncharacterized protein LOC117277503 [Nicotiana tomentosiformis]
MHEFSEAQKLIQFLSELNKTYSTVKSNILMMSPVPSMEKAYFILIRDEKQRKINSGSQSFSPDSTSFITNSNSGPSQSNTTRNFTQRVNFEPRRTTLSCKYCKKPGHTVDKCYKLHGFLPDFKFTKGKRVAACVQVESTNQTPPKLDSPQTEDIPHGDVTFAEYIFPSTSTPSGFFSSSTSSFPDHFTPNHAPTPPSPHHSPVSTPNHALVPSPTIETQTLIPLSAPSSPLLLRRSSRTTVTPTHLKDYLCYVVPLPNSAISSRTSSPTLLLEPFLYHQAASNPAWQELDVNNAFLHGDLFEEVYMKVPLGLTVSSSCSGPPLFKIKDLGSVHYFLGLEVSHLPQGLLLNQHKYLKELLTEFHCASVSPVVTPLDMSIKLTPSSDYPLADPFSYRRLISKLNFLALH